MTTSFRRRRLHRAPISATAFLEGRKDRLGNPWRPRDINAAALDRAPRGCDEGVINADGSDL